MRAGSTRPCSTQDVPKKDQMLGAEDARAGSPGRTSLRSTHPFPIHLKTTRPPNNGALPPPPPPKRGGGDFQTVIPVSGLNMTLQHKYFQSCLSPVLRLALFFFLRFTGWMAVATTLSSYQPCGWHPNLQSDLLQTPPFPM